VLSGLQLPDPPPSRVYISGHLYRIAAPQVALPPLINTVKTILNWVGPAGAVARNVLYVLKGSGPGSTSDPAWLQALGNAVMTALGSAALGGQVATQWILSSVTCKDNGGTSAQAQSTHSQLPGSVSGGVLPPQAAIVISWQIAEVYRGGKPRTYLPGVPTAALEVVGGSKILDTFATNTDTMATTFLTNFNSTPVTGTTVTLGTVSYHTGHAVRPTPLFRTYFAVKVHERLDSQRRRSGKESSFPVTP
jgi:hypothetical protein